PASVGCNEQFSCFGVALLANLLPPRFDRRHGEDGGVVVDTNAYKSSIGGHVVHAVGDRLANGSSRKVVHVDKFWLAFGLPFASTVLEVADELLLLRVDGNYRSSLADVRLSLGVDVLELRIAIRVLGSLHRLVGRLQAVAVLAQQLGYRLIADTNAVSLEHLGRQRVRAFASPP